MTEATIEQPILAHLRAKANQAHRNTSFSPEKRGENMVNDYSAELTQDMEELRTGGASEESIADYNQRYERYFVSYLHAKSNCFSVMITGAGNFPVRRHEKANRSEHRHYEIFREWRVRAKKAILRKPREEKTFLSEADRYTKELEAMKANHEKMKNANKRIAQARKTGEDLTEFLTVEMEVAPHMVDWALKFGFGLSNSNANMKRLEDRIKLMERKEERANTRGAQELSFEGFTVTLNHEADRIQIKHDSKPSRDVIDGLKRKGFRWSPTFGAWQRQLNNNGIDAANSLLNIKIAYL